MEKVMTKTIAKKLRAEFEKGTKLYLHYHDVFQKLIEYVKNGDRYVYLVFENEFEDNFHTILLYMGYPSMDELMEKSRTFKKSIHYLYLTFYDCLKNIIKDMAEEYPEVNLNIIDDYEVVITLKDSNSLNEYIEEFCKKGCWVTFYHK